MKVDLPYPPIILLESDDTTTFLRAARSGNLEKVVEYLDTNLDINTANSNGLNALHLASKDGHVEIVTELLKRGAKVDAATKKGNTALHIASLAGQSEIVNILIQYGAAVNIQSQNGFTPLYMAAQENHDQVVKLLLSNGANQSLATEDGFTPLAVAMQQGHDKVVSVLLENDSKGKVRLPALHIAAKKNDCKAADLLLQNDHKPDVTSKSGFTPLHIAAHYGNEEIGRLLIKKGADVNYLAKHNISPLHVAAKWGKNNMVKLLLENSAMIDAKTRDGLTPLHCAARSGHEEVVSTLLEYSAPISARTKNGLAPLHMASQGDHVDAARVLLYHRAPVDEVTIDYLTSLHVAAHCGHVRVAKLLLDRKADPNARALNGFTPLHIACKKNRIKIVELLLKHGASIESTTESGLTPLHVASFMGCMNIVIFLLQHEANPDVPTIRGETPLHLAARANQTDIIRILLRNGAKVDARAREDQTPLHIASRLGNVDIVMLLLQHGASVDDTTKDMYTALHIAAKEGQEEIAAILVDNHASVKAVTKNGFTPLHIAAKYGNMNVAKILLQKDSKLDFQGKNDITPLHLACHYDHPNVASVILEKGGSPHLSTQNGHTPLHIAARKNQIDIASTLLDLGADPNAQSKAGFTPLQLSAQKGHYDMTNLLIEHGADPNHKAKNGLTALHLCAQEDSIRVASVLVKNGADVESQTESGYRPIHVAAHFGNLPMIRFLLKHSAQIDVPTHQNYTPMHQAAQQGHAHVVSALLEENAPHNKRTKDGLTPLNIAQKLGYISVMEVLKGLEYDTQTPDNKTWEEKYRVIAPESLHETSFISDSDDELGDVLTNEQPYRYLTVDIMKSLRDDSLPIDVTRDDPVHRQLSTDETKEFTQSNNYCPPENFDSTEGINLGFLVSFLIDARGGTMKGCRHSGIRIIIPPRRASMPIRVTCKLVKPSKIHNPPALMEGEALATRIIEMGPVGVTFLGPVLIDIPHFASVQDKEREIIILRSENGETWKEHDNSHENDDSLFNTSYDVQMSASYTGRVTRIITTDFPQYFAIVTRIKQEVHVIGADGGILISSVANHIQAVFPPGALTKKIKVGLQAHIIPTELTAKLLGNCVAVSPVITIEPRRRKFHKPITLTIPVPQAANKGMINEYGGETPTLRLLCSIAGGTSEAQWEDVTGSTPLTFLNDRVSFTTTVSARFWLMDCRNISEVPKMATELYKESLYVPFITNFIIYTKRSDVLEASLRILCMTDGKEGMHTLEKQEEFIEIVKSRDVEALDGKNLYIEFSGNLVPVTKSGQQLKLNFKAFRQNRLSFHVKVKDPLLDPVARMLFMRDPKVAKGEPSQQPICVLNIVLPEVTVSKSESNLKLKELDFNIINKMDMYKTTYMRDYGEKRDIPKPTTSPNKEYKHIIDTLQKEEHHPDAATFHESLAQKVACPLKSVEASYPNNIEETSPELENQTYSEKRKFWEDITKKRESYQRSESEISRTSQVTFNESDSENIQNLLSEDDAIAIPERSETIEDLNIPDMSECSVAEKAHYFEEQIQKELTISTKITTKLTSQDSISERRGSFDAKEVKQSKNEIKADNKEKEKEQEKAKALEEFKEEKSDIQKSVPEVDLKFKEIDVKVDKFSEEKIPKEFEIKDNVSEIQVDNFVEVTKTTKEFKIEDNTCEKAKDFEMKDDIEKLTELEYKSNDFEIKDKTTEKEIKKLEELKDKVPEKMLEKLNFQIKSETVKPIETKPSMIPKMIKADLSPKSKEGDEEEKKPAAKETFDEKLQFEATKTSEVDAKLKSLQKSDELFESKSVSKIPTKIKTELISKFEVKEDKDDEKKQQKIEKEIGKKESRIPIPSKLLKEKIPEVKEEAVIKVIEEKVVIKPEISDGMFDETSLKEETVTVTKTITEKVSQHYEKRTTEITTQSQTITTTITDPEEALKLFESGIELSEPEKTEKTSTVDHVESKKLEEKEIISSETLRGDEKIIKHAEKDSEVEEISQKVVVTQQRDQETIEDQTNKLEKLNKTLTQEIAVNICEDKQMIDATAHQAILKVKEDEKIKSVEDESGILVDKAGKKVLKEQEMEAVMTVEEGKSLDEDLKPTLVHEHFVEESSEYSDTQKYPSKSDKGISEEQTDIEDLEKDSPEEEEARNIAENLVQSIEEEIMQRSDSFTGMKLGFEFEGVEQEDLDEQLADDLTKKFETIMGKRKESQAQVIESVEQIRAIIFHEDRLEKDSTRGSLSISEDLTRDEDSTPHDRDDEEESFPSSLSQPKNLDRDMTVSPSSISDQIELEESFEYDKQPKETNKPIIEFPTELKVAEEYIEEIREVVVPLESSSSGARVLEILEPEIEYESRQDSIDVSSLEIDDLQGFKDLQEKMGFDGTKHRESGVGVISTTSVSVERDWTVSPSSISDLSMLQEPSLNSKISEIKSGNEILEPEDVGFSSMEPEKIEFEKPCNIVIEKEKMETPEIEMDLLKQASPSPSCNESEDLESIIRSSEEISEVESVKKVSSEEKLTPTKLIISPPSETEAEQELVENKLDVSCEELMDTLQREYEAKTPTDERIPVTPRQLSESEEELEVEKKPKKEPLSKLKLMGDSKRHPEKTGESKVVTSCDLSPLKLKKEEKNVDLSARYAITVLDQVVKKEIAEVKESLEAAKQDLIEELSENNEKITIKESPSEFQFKLQPESIPNDLPILYKAPSVEQVELDFQSEIPVAKPRRHTLTQESEKKDDDDIDNDEEKKLEVSETDDVKISVQLDKSSKVSSDAEEKESKDDPSSSLSIPPQPIPRRRQQQQQKKVSKKVHSENEGSSSGESSNYQSCDYDIGSGSRPSSSDVEALQSASGFLSGTSEYETAMMSVEQSSKQTSQEYQSAVSTLSSRESMKSLNSLSSGHLGSIDSTSDLTETLIASESEADKDEINENLELALDSNNEQELDSSGSELVLEQSFDQQSGDVVGKMKRSLEMVFQQILDDTDSSLVPDTLEGSFDDESKGQSTKVTSSILISEDTDVKISTIADPTSEQISERIEDSSEDVKLKPLEAQATGDDVDQSELKMPSSNELDEAEALLLSKRSILQQASMSTSSTSGVSMETVIEKEMKADRHSPDSDSFELVDKPDLTDDFVIIEEVGREAREFDTEGKSISIKTKSQVITKRYDRDVENLITETKEVTKVSTSQESKQNAELFDFESEESPPQASNEDQYSQSYSDDEQESKKWVEMQYQGDPRGYDLEFDRGPLEDIKEEEITDFEAGSSRFGSLGSQRGSMGSSGSMKGSYGTEYDILAGKKLFSKSIEHDNISMNSLQEFESLERVVIGDPSKKFQCGSQDSVNNGSLPRRYITSRSGHGDDVSVSSLKDFEGLESACRDAHMVELRAKEEEDLLEHESPENRYRLENLPKPKLVSETTATSSFNPSTSGSDDYEKRIMEIDEIIRIAQANVEKMDKQDDTTEDISQIDILDPEKVDPVPASIPLDVDDKIQNVMETSTDSLELEDQPDKQHNLICRSSDSLELKTTVDFPSLSYSDSLNNVCDSQETHSANPIHSARCISSDSLEIPPPDQATDDKSLPAKSDSFNDSKNNIQNH